MCPNPYCNILLSGRVVQPGERLEWIQRVAGGKRKDKSQAPAQLEVCQLQCLLDMTTALVPKKSVLILSCPYSEVPLL